MHKETTVCWLTVSLVLKSKFCSALNFHLSLAQLCFYLKPVFHCSTSRFFPSTAAHSSWLLILSCFSLETSAGLMLSFIFLPTLKLMGKLKCFLFFFPLRGSALHCALLKYSCQKLFICVPEKSTFPDQTLCCFGLVPSKQTCKQTDMIFPICSVNLLPHPFPSMQVKHCSTLSIN